MATAIKRRRGTTVQHSTFIGQLGELTVDTDKKTVVVHDGVRAGGFPLQHEAFISVRRFGAKGDNATDDTVAIQAAVAYASANGVPTVYFPGGTYWVTAALAVGSNVHLTGEGRSSVLMQKWNGIVIQLQGSSNVEISHLKIVGNRATYPNNAANAIHVDWTTVAGTNVVVRDMDVSEVSGAGIIALAAVGTPSSFLIIEDCVVKNTGTHGILVQDYVSDVRIVGNTVTASGLGTASRPLITGSRHGSRIVISRNIVTGSVGYAGGDCHGISLDSGTDVVCSDNVISVNCASGYGIEVGFCTSAVVKGNIVSNTPGGPGIGLSGNGALPHGYSDGVSIASNIIEATCGTGIAAYMDNPGTFRHQKITITGNTIMGTAGDAGIFIVDADSVTISGNTATNCKKSGIYCVDVTGQFISANVVMYNNIAVRKTVTTLTQAAGTATATVANHGLATGNMIRVVGAVPGEYNVPTAVAITVVDANTFTYPVPAGSQTPAVGGLIEMLTTQDTEHGGIRVIAQTATYRDRNFMGSNHCERNGNRDHFDHVANSCGPVGFSDGRLILREASNNLNDYQLSSQLSANVMDRLGIYMKNNNFVVAYSLAGTIKYLVIPLDGATTAFAIAGAPP